jgi:hypothetical protein
LPTLFWLNASDTALFAGAVAGAMLGLLIAANLWTRPALIGAFALYLSYAYAGQEFMSFQWDSLLLETGFLAIFLTGGSRVVVWLYRWLAFRYLFLAGVVKLLSGDQTWRTLSALDFHFWTQPLPTPLAWYSAQLPHALLVGGTAATLAIELVIVFLIFLPRRPRALAALCAIAFQALIVLTGNYNFFNLLTILFCVFLLDDAAVRPLFPPRFVSWVQRRAPQPGRTATTIAAVVAFVTVPAGVNVMAQTVANVSVPVARTLAALVSPLLIVNRYGLFAVMTTSRPEIIVEGSNDGETWREYAFRYKPGALTRAPRWNIPHQPRLDWQMWFAALGNYRQNPWYVGFMYRLLEGSEPVLALLDGNPFPDGPPRFVRAKLYEYRFSDASTRATTGQWWVREPAGLYFPKVSLADFVRPGR